MDADLRQRLWRLACQHSIPVVDIPSGGGHDCAVFANLGIPSAMIFVRNDHGSHNPDEAMALDDFAEAMRLLMYLVDELVLS
jgi:N-carbamoyl-L-amino-acid hydrolase